MNFADFVRRFPEHKEIGRDLTDSELRIFFDNGEEVGAWRENRRTTVGAGEVLGEADAEMARHWCRVQKMLAGRGDAQGPQR
jgi:hypothetical protein